MKRLLPLIICFALMAAFPKPKKVIFFGDSITQAGAQTGGYIKLIDSICQKEGRAADFEFVGKGIGGNKVTDLYLRLERDVLDLKPDVVIIYIGINDVWHKSGAGTGTDADKFLQFYQTIIDKLKAAGIKVILCTPSVIGERTDFSNQQDGDLNLYANNIRELASKNGLQLIDLRKSFLDYNFKNNPTNADRGILTTDRVHLNAQGNLLVAQEMWKAIK
ncbi:MAG: SGNH/GDSL hydrolase family protein [Chitinophagaceae bacterium]|nr:SGNH/GDSL hydrolase family protein [Chitinophagaceae bacterium]